MDEQARAIDWLIENDQDMLYEIREHLRDLFEQTMVDEAVFVEWLQAEYTERLTQEHKLILDSEQWRDLAESCLADTRELVDYERAHG